MGCLCTHISVVKTGLETDVKEVSKPCIKVLTSIICSRLFIRTKILEGLLCKIQEKVAHLFCKIRVKDNGIQICTSLVCSVGPRDYYLTANGDYLITVDKEFIRVTGI